MSCQLFRLAIALITFTLGVGSNAATRKIQTLEFEYFVASATKAPPELRAQPAPVMTGVEPIAVGGDDSSIEPESSSPYEIARVVNKSREQSERYRTLLEVDLSWTWKQLDIEPGYFETCNGDCDAEVFTHELDGEPGEEVLLKLTKSRNHCRYVLFKGSETVGVEQKLIGHVDYDLNKYAMSTHRFVSTTDENWLVIRGLEGSGSGFSVYGETWYEVRRKSLHRVLHYPSSGRTSGGPDGVSRVFEAKVAPFTRTKEKGEERAVTIRYTVSYSTWDLRTEEDAPLYENEHNAHYVWNEKKHEFVFETKQSDIEEDEIFAIAGYEDVELEIGVYDFFFKYNLEGLLQIARGPDGERKEWLRRLLGDRADSPATAALLKALNN